MILATGFVLVVLAIGGATFLLATADPGHTNTGPTCQVTNPSTGDEECPYNSALGSTDVLLNWNAKGDLPSDASKRLCFLSCSRDDDENCSSFFRADGQGYASSTGRDLYPKDSIKIFKPRIGNIYRAICVGPEEAKSTKTLLNKVKAAKSSKSLDDLALASSGEMKITQGTGANPGGKLDIEPANGTNFYPGYSVKLNWKITDPKCQSSKLSFLLCPIVFNEVQYKSCSPDVVNSSGSSGEYNFDWLTIQDIDQAYAPLRQIPHLIEGRISSGSCAGDYDNYRINVQVPSVSVSAPNGGDYYYGDKVDINWSETPSIPNVYTVKLTLVGQEGNTCFLGVRDQEIPNNGHFTFTIPEKLHQTEKAYFEVCYFNVIHAEYENPEPSEGDWSADCSVGLRSICGKSGTFSIKGAR